MPSVFAYRMTFDLGFAPNPFHGVCTLATCKPRVRQGAGIGDYVVGTSSYDPRLRKRVPPGSVIYVMRVTDKICFDDYWIDHPVKRPDMGGSRIERYGDNIYHRERGEWCQADSRHSLPNGEPSLDDIRTDTGLTDQVLLSTDFTYWGANAIALPPYLAQFGHATLREKRSYAPQEVDAFVAWAEPLLGGGRLGWPSDWDPA